VAWCGWRSPALLSTTVAGGGDGSDHRLYAPKRSTATATRGEPHERDHQAARLADGHVRREGVDLDGRVIGIPTTLAALDSDLGDTAPPAIGFAIASNQVRTVARRIGVEKAFGPCLPTPCSTRAGCRASAHRGHHPYCSEG
jgi:hypothetical protein